MDPLITELVTASRTAESDVLPSIVEALAAVARSAGKNIGPAVKETLMELIDEAFEAKTSGMFCQRGVLQTLTTFHETHTLQPWAN